MKKQPGFTLIELMIVVAIMGFLATLAYPSYSDYLIRGRIPDATSALAAKRVQMEQFFQDNRRYDQDTGGTANPVCAADQTSSRFFTLSCSAVGTDTYTLQAVGRDQMLNFTYTINNANTKTSTITRARWANTSLDCWIIRKDGSCS